MRVPPNSLSGRGKRTVDWVVYPAGDLKKAALLARYYRIDTGTESGGRRKKLKRKETRPNGAVMKLLMTTKDALRPSRTECCVASTLHGPQTGVMTFVEGQKATPDRHFRPVTLGHQKPREKKSSGITDFQDMDPLADYIALLIRIVKMGPKEISNARNRRTRWPIQQLIHIASRMPYLTFPLLITM